MGECRGQGGFESSLSGGSSQGRKESAGAGERRGLEEGALEAMMRLPFSPPFPSVFASCLSEG